MIPWHYMNMAIRVVYKLEVVHIWY